MNQFRDPPITRRDLCAILHPIVPRDVTLYWAALTHTSVASVLLKSDDDESIVIHDFYKRGHPLFGNNYEKLEFLGDSIIHTALASILIRMYPDKDEGFLSRVRINIERKSGLAQLARQLGLSRFVVKHPDLQLTDAILENVYEGFIGALFEDQQMFLYNGLQRSNEFILRTLKFMLPEIRNDDNFKDTVLRLLDRHVFENISFEYTLSNERELVRRKENHITTLLCLYSPKRVEYVQNFGYSNPDLQSVVTSIPCLHVKTLKITRRGRNKRESEQSASRELMKILRIRMKSL